MLERIVVTGANGLMGRELSKGFIPLIRQQMDITNEKQVKQVLGEIKPDLVVHLAAYTDLVGAERDKQVCYDVNVVGTRNIARNCSQMLYVSTEYVFDGAKGNYTEQDYPNPLQFYGLTKLLGEAEVRECKHGVVVRTLFKPRPYKHALVPTGMMTSGGYVDDIARELIKAIDNFDRLPPIINIGTERRSLKDLALETREVGDVDIDSLPIKIPLDASLNINLWRKICPKD